MDRYVEKAKEWTGCDNAKVICSTDGGKWNLIVCSYTDDDGYCHCWLLRVWDNPFSVEPNVSVDYENTTKMEDAHEQMALLGCAIAKWIPNYSK